MRDNCLSHQKADCRNVTVGHDHRRIQAGVPDINIFLTIQDPLPNRDVETDAHTNGQEVKRPPQCRGTSPDNLLILTGCETRG